MRLLVGFLIAALQVGAVSGPAVINSGYPGCSTPELDAKMDGVLAAAKPSYVVLMAGANDALNEKKFVSPQETRAHLTAMVQKAQIVGAKVLLVTTHDPDLERLLQRHRLEDYAAVPPLARLATVNAMVAEVAAQKGATLVDFHTVLAEAGGTTRELSTDGLHLTPKGYGLLAEAVRARLPEIMSSADRILCFGDSLTYGQGVRGPGVDETPQTYPSQLRALLRR